MSKPLEFTFYLNSMNTGSMVLKAPGQYYKIGELIAIVPLAAEMEQFIRSVSAGANPHSLFALADLNIRKYDFELNYVNDKVQLSLWLKTADAGKALLFDWTGSFRDFGDGFKVF